MQKSSNIRKFDTMNMLAEEAVEELINRLTKVNIAEVSSLPTKHTDILHAYEISGEPSYGENYLFIRSNKKVLYKLINYELRISDLSTEEWSELLTHSPSNKLIYKYFRKVHNAFKTRIISKNKYESAYNEILNLLEIQWRKSHKI